MEYILKLIVAEESEPQEFKLEGHRITVGRDPSNQIAISETYVSSRHAILSIDEAENLFVEDCDSANGTFVNNSRVLADKRPLKSGDRIKFSRVEFEVVGESDRKWHRRDSIARSKERKRSNHDSVDQSGFVKSEFIRFIIGLGASRKSNEFDFTVKAPISQP